MLQLSRCLRHARLQHVGELVLVDDQDVDRLQEPRRQDRVERRVVEDHAGAGVVGDAGRGLDRVGADLHAQPQHTGLADDVLVPLRRRDVHSPVRSGRHHDGVVPRAVDGDDGGSGGHVLTLNRGGVHTGALEGLDEQVAMTIPSDGPNHPHVSTEKTGLNRLVRRLPARQDHEVLPADRLTGFGKALRSDREISIERSEDGDLSGYVTQDSSYTRPHFRFLSAMQHGYTPHHTTPHREAALPPVLTAGRRRLVRRDTVRHASTRTSMASGRGRSARVTTSTRRCSRARGRT